MLQQRVQVLHLPLSLPQLHQLLVQPSLHQERVLALGCQLSAQLFVVVLQDQHLLVVGLAQLFQFNLEGDALLAGLGEFGVLLSDCELLLPVAGLQLGMLALQEGQLLLQLGDLVLEVGLLCKLLRGNYSELLLIKIE